MIPGPPTSTLFPYTTLFRSVRLVGERADGQAGEFHRVLDSGLLERDVRHLANDRLRPVERGGIGKLGDRDERSEEHTSELQSHVNLVCRLLLEKKKTNIHSM